MRFRNGEPAFPTGSIVDTNPGAIADAPGMSLRDYFAGQALAGLMATPEWEETPGHTAETAYAFADAMLATREES